MRKRNIVILTTVVAVTVVTLGMGGAQAANDKLFGSNDIKDHSIRVKDLAPGAVDKLQGQQGPAGPQGVKGAQGDKGDKGDKGDRGAPGNAVVATYTRTDSVALAAGASGVINVACDAGDVASGGGYATHGTNVLVYENLPDFIDETRPTVPTGWLARATAGAVAGSIDVWVVCAL